MQKWEYLFVQFDAAPHGVLGLEGKAKKVNGQELPDWKKGPGVYELFNQLGDQGWEFIGMLGRNMSSSGSSLNRGSGVPTCET